MDESSSKPTMYVVNSSFSKLSRPTGRHWYRTWARLQWFVYLVAFALLATLRFPLYSRTEPFRVVWSRPVVSDTGNESTGAVFTPLQPPSYPLAVRNPYLSAWLPGSGAATLPTTQAQFWTGAADLTWSILARVDGTPFNLFGVPYSEGYIAPRPAVVLSATYTATHSIFVLKADNVHFTLDFFSPVSPKNYLRQSLPFSYFTVKAEATDASSSTVQVYTDIDETWTGQTANTTVEYKKFNDVHAFHFKANESKLFEESADMALWGRFILGAQQQDNAKLTWSAGRLASVRGEFARNGTLNNQVGIWKHGSMNGFTPVRSVAGLSRDLGIVTKSEEKQATFAIGHVRDSAINYLNETHTHYYRATYPKAMAALEHFLGDYRDALHESRHLDKVIQQEGEASAGPKYAAILALSLRQTFGGLDLTIPIKTLDTNDAMAWIKEHSSNGNINTVDIIYPAFPIFYLLNPDWIRLLIEPLMRYLNTDRYKNPYAVHDIGTSYPLAIGHDDLKEEPMPIESTGNILILILAYTRSSGDDTYWRKYGPLLKRYVDYLVKHGLHPEDQLSTNDAIGSIANQTNLGVKAAVAINAYAHLVGDKDLEATARDYATQIYTTLGVHTPNSTTDSNSTTSQTNHKHSTRKYFTISYGSPHWFTPFNLYPDVLLNLTTFPRDAISLAAHTPIRRPAGVALMQTVNWGKTDWQMFAAGFCDRVAPKVRDAYVEDLHKFISNGLNTAPFSDRYWVADAHWPKRGLSFFAGQVHSFRARPTLGAHFSLVALKGGRYLDKVLEESLARGEVLFDAEGGVDGENEGEGWEKVDAGTA